METALTVGEAPGGAMLRLSGLSGGAVLANVAGAYGAIGSLQVGEVALTEADGVTPLISDFSLLPVDLPFDFNTFDLTADIDVELPSIDLSAAAFPYIDLSVPGLPSLNLPNLDLALPDVDFSSLTFPELAIELPKLPGLDLSLPDLNLGLPNFSLPDLAVQFPSLDIDWPNLTLPEIVFSIPSLNIPGVDLDIDGLLDVFDFGWPTVGLDGLAALFPDLTFDWPNLTLPNLIAALPDLNLPGLSITFPDISGVDWPDVTLPNLEIGRAHV